MSGTLETPTAPGVGAELRTEGMQTGVAAAPAAEASDVTLAELLAVPCVARQRRPLRRFVIDLGAGALMMMLLHLFVVQVSIVKGHSMQPSLWDGDRLVVDRISYALMDVDRFDLIVLRYPLNPEIDFVKRVVGLPEDVVAIDNGQVIVNGRPVEMPCHIVHDHDRMPPVRVPAGAYFVLGDNRPVSCDSREFRFVPAEHVKGKVRARFWPVDRISVF